MISSYYSLLAAALAVIASRTTPAVASSFVSNQLIGDHIVKRTLEEEGDDLVLISAECESELVIVQARIEEEFAAGNLSYSCKDAGGKVIKLEFEGTCPAIDLDGFISDHCAGTSCTVKELQASVDASVTAGQSSGSFEGCSNFKVSSPEESSGAFSLGTAGCCVMASLLLSTAALLN
mmetsp:Transcript_30121/g.30476  ORF Transcript_30121/g.30476 Transcript_30121/m.30476 type:complete len:178 (-) Transcript_30121:222-755(-)|eukprot:CAMPEP_0171309368 /NCGR_PEP_ID=MMETSP0816-20121228/19535_1 /TAXON_ID=420281 /ORGANISM="Proboscia inermis, Strain CCAP1064/1" /LENGTH=177 /DNA_ID=CAMNT_0011792859 /DNA_START=27 /DNA_END=560 /DNA_ORIENTATION=+